MPMQYNDLKALAKAAIKADKNSPVAYTFSQNGNTVNLSAEDLNDTLRAQFQELGGTYQDYRENKNLIFRLIEETVDEVLPARVEQQYMQFAEVKTIAQGDRAIFRKRVSEAARKRAKTFVTKVGLAGRYEVFMLDGMETEVKTNAIGAAARIGFEEFLDGRWQFSDFTDIIVEAMDEYIYQEIAKALEAMINNLQAANKAAVAGFDAQTMDQLLAIADSYGHSTIYCTYEFAATMIPDDGWASSSMKDALWEKGYLGNYKGHNVVILPQSMTDQTNTQKVIDPSYAYIFPVGTEKPVKLVFEGQTCVREVEDNDDWSRDMQTYKKFGVATVFTTNNVVIYQNTDLKKATR